MKKIWSILAISIILLQQVGLFVLYAENEGFTSPEVANETPIGIPSPENIEREEMLSSDEHSTQENLPALTNSSDNEEEIQTLTNEITLPKLLITEVYFDGTEEFLEISNSGESDFHGEITLIKDNNNRSSHTITIPVQTSFLFARKDIFLNLAYTPFTLSLTDTNAINLQLKVGEAIIDSFFVATGEVKKLDNKKTSFEKKEENGSYIIIPTSSEKNMKPGYTANPGVFSNFSGDESSSSPSHAENPSETNTDSSNTSGEDSNTSAEPGEEETNNEQTPTLILTEAFFHKENSRVEISNISDQDYQGEVKISGFSKGKVISTSSLTIPKKSTVLIAKNNKYLDEKVKLWTYKDFGTIDRKNSLTLELTYLNKKDQFSVHQDWMKKIQGSDTSFEKIQTSEGWLTTRTTLDRRKNIRGSLVANPGIFFTEAHAENAKDISQAIEKENIPTNLQDPLCQEFSDRYRFEIREIFAGNSIYPAFIEVEITDTPSSYQSLKLKGELFAEDIIVDISDTELEKKDTFLISQSDFWENKGIDSVFSVQFDIKNPSGKVILEGFDGQSRQVLDIVNVKEVLSGQSSYFNGNKEGGCVSSFGEYGDFSPGFARKFLEYFKIDTTPKVEYIYVNKGGNGGGGGSFSCPTKADLCPSPEDQKTTPLPLAENSEKIIEKKSDFPLPASELESGKSTTGANNFENYQVKIEDIVYDPPGADKDQESITLLLLSGEELDLKKTTLIINGKNKKLSGSLEKGVSQTLKGSFGFPNSSKTSDTIKVELKMGNQLLDTYYYQLTDQSTKEKKEQNKKPEQEGYKVFSVLDGDTFRYRDESGKLQSVRLLGVDSPESNTARYKKTECYGQEAKTYLTQLIKGKYVKLVFDEEQQSRDSYGRYLAYVYLDDLLVNQELIRQGYAKEYTYKTVYQQQSLFKNAEEEAKSKKVGMWNPAFCPNNLEDEAQKIENIQNLILKINHIDFDPQGSDKGNEKIILSAFLKNGNMEYLDFTQQWGIFIFEDTGSGNQISLDDLENGKAKFKDLSFLGKVALSDRMSLQGDFALPNTNK